MHRDYTLGTTSAYAENTHENPPERRRLGNYLRVRGEYGYWHDLVYKKQELPPRTRRIPLSYCSIISASGTTSAYAENTKKRFHRIKTNRNYLRVRGEYAASSLKVLVTLELPPRTRRIRNLNKQRRRRDGTTSAYAENTIPRPRDGCVWRNYLRVRGEYDLDRQIFDFNEELPPRTRRIP